MLVFYAWHFFSFLSLQGLCGTLRVQTWSFLGWHCQDTGWVFLRTQNKDRKLRSWKVPVPTLSVLSPLLWGLWCFSGRRITKWDGELIKQRFPGPTLGFSVCGKGSEEPPPFCPRSSLSDSETGCPKKLCWPYALSWKPSLCAIYCHQPALSENANDVTGPSISSFVLCADVLRRAVWESPDVFIQWPKESESASVTVSVGDAGSRIQGKVVEEELAQRQTWGTRDPHGQRELWQSPDMPEKKKFKQRIKQNCKKWKWKISPSFHCSEIITLVLCVAFQTIIIQMTYIFIKTKQIHYSSTICYLFLFNNISWISFPVTLSTSFLW